MKKRGGLLWLIGTWLYLHLFMDDFYTKLPVDKVHEKMIVYIAFHV